MQKDLKNKARELLSDPTKLNVQIRKVAIMYNETRKLAKSISPLVLTHLDKGNFNGDEVLAIDMIKSGFNKDFIERTCGLVLGHYGRIRKRCELLGISLLQYCEEAEQAV